MYAIMMFFYQRRTPVAAVSVTPDDVLRHEARVREDREAMLRP